MLGQRSYGAEALAALVALDLHAAVGMHALVPAQVRELGVRLEADLALERLYRRVDVRVLLEPGRGRERLPALWAGVTAGSHVVGADVPLKVRRIAEDLQREKKRNKNEPQLSKIDFSFTQIGNDVARANSDPGDKLRAAIERDSFVRRNQHNYGDRSPQVMARDQIVARALGNWKSMNKQT